MIIFNSTSYKILELITLSIIIPFIISYFKFSSNLLLFLWAILIYCLFIFYLCEEKYYKSKHKNLITKNVLEFAFIRWVVFSFCLFIFTFHVFPEKLFIVQKSNPGFIWKIIIFYPFFSALPQEFIFCKFFFARYKSFFGEKTLMVAMSSLAFCLAHILFINWVAPVLGLAAGIIFAGTYKKTKSLLMVSLEHSLYGDTLFFIGLGWFFWGGAVN